ncbi:MAG: pseudouridine synthase [Bacteroidia bacterium]|nr:pseudouridine synthase [Bacteroidia bacterium]
MENDFNKSDSSENRGYRGNKSYQGNDRSSRPYSGNDRNNSGNDRGNRPYSGNDRNGPGNDRGNRPYQGNDRNEGNNRGNFQKRNSQPYNRPGSNGSDKYGGKPQYGVRKPPPFGFQKKKKETVQNQEFPPDYEMRLNRFLSAAGVCSRREADKFIKAGVVTVNGTVVEEMGIKVKMSDDIRYNGVKLIPEKKIYLVLNKPRNYITTANDPHADKTVMDLVRNAGNRRLFPVGRLDRHTTGVLIFTNDGDLTKKLTHPKSNVKKIYHVYLDKPLTNDDFDRLSDGLELDDGFFKPDLVGFVKDDDKRQLGIEIHSGRNRIVRRLFDHMGYKIKKLDRVYFAGVTKKKLGRGRWRFLSKQEVYSLEMGGHVRENNDRR